MALNISGNPYGGAEGVKLMSKFIFASPTAQYMTVYEGVKNSTFNLPILTPNGSLADPSCDFTASGDIALGFRAVTVKTLVAEREICIDDALEGLYAAQKNRLGANNTELPFEQWLIETEGRKIAQVLDGKMWSGAAGSGSFDGLLTIAAADSGTVKVTGTTLTVSNILAEVAKVYAAIPSDIAAGAALSQDAAKTGTKLFISKSNVNMFKAAMAATGYRNDYTYNGVPMLNYLDLEVVPTNMPANKMLATTVENLALVTDLVSDMDMLQIKDMREQELSDKFRMKMRFHIGVNYAVSSDVVYYG